MLAAGFSSAAYTPSFPHSRTPLFPGDGAFSTPSPASSAGRADDDFVPWLLNDGELQNANSCFYTWDTLEFCNPVAEPPSCLDFNGYEKYPVTPPPTAASFRGSCSPSSSLIMAHRDTDKDVSPSTASNNKLEESPPSLNYIPRSILSDSSAASTADFLRPYPVTETNPRHYQQQSEFQSNTQVRTELEFYSTEQRLSNREVAELGKSTPSTTCTIRKAENEDEEQSVELVNLLVSCVEAVAVGNLAYVNHYLSRLGSLASPTGSSMHRLAAYYTEGLACRAAKLWPEVYTVPAAMWELASTGQVVGTMATKTVMNQQGGDESGTDAWQVLNQATPIVKFSHFTANEMILEALAGEDRVHIVDLDIRQGLQWPGLLYSLATRPGGPPQHVRLTGVGECKDEVADAGDRLAGFAAELGLKFEYHGVVDPLEDVRLWMLHVKTSEPRESVAVNCIMQMHKALGEENSGTANTNANYSTNIKKLLDLVASMKPKVVALVEQEADFNDQPSWEARVAASLRYFAALFDGLDCQDLPQSSRLKLEGLLAAQIRNVVGCDGGERVERYQIWRRWRSLMESCGFRCLPISQNARLQAQLLLQMFGGNDGGAAKFGGGTGYRLLPVDDDRLRLTLGWDQQPLFTASAWAPS